MGADIKSLRNRIRSVDSTLHLTKAMGLVASSKIRRATMNMNRSREYTASMEEVVGLLAASPDCAKSPYMTPKGHGDRVIVIAGDRGLAGGYNANVFRLAATLEGARLGILYTRYRSLMTQEATLLWVLPLGKGSENGSAAPIFEPDEQTVLDAAVPTYVSGMLTACVRESFASEVAARRMAMDSAGKNAQEMIDRLQLQYNRARQNAITQEITEIVAGAGSN